MKIRQALKLLGRTKHFPNPTGLVFGKKLWPIHCIKRSVSLPQKRSIKVAQRRVNKWQRKFVTFKGSNMFTEFYSTLHNLENTFHLIAFDPSASTKGFSQLSQFKSE